MNRVMFPSRFAHIVISALIFRRLFRFHLLQQYDSPTLPEADCQFAVGPSGKIALNER